jgi:plastocyanin
MTHTRRDVLRGVAGVAGASAGAATAATAQEEVRIDMTNGLVFDPDDVTVTPGTTVTWETVESVPHSVTAYEDDIPEDAAYFASGGFESEDAARANESAGLVDEGETYSHTFQVEGTHEYFCIPHESAGMLGTVEVSTDTAPAEPPFPEFPNSALTVGVAAIGTMLSVLALVYVFLKYGGNYGEGGGGSGSGGEGG